jgi:5-methylcytosine-specific restriction endonuclease McrA
MTDFYVRAMRSKRGYFLDCKSCHQLARVKKVELKVVAADYFTSATKVCTRCKKELPRTNEFFNNRGKAQDGFQPKCRECQSAERKNHYLRNQEAERASAKEYNANNREMLRIKKYLARLENREERALYAKDYNRENPEVTAAAAHNRRARELGIPGRVTRFELRELLELQKNICPHCQREMVGLVRLTLDHIIPVSRRELNPTGSIENFVWTCWTCNRDKWSSTPEEWVNRWYEIPEIYKIITERENSSL